MRKINNSFKIPRNKPNIRIATFLGIWMPGVMWIPPYQMPPYRLERLGRRLPGFIKKKKRLDFLFV